MALIWDFSLLFLFIFVAIAVVSYVLVRERRIVDKHSDALIRQEAEHKFALNRMMAESDSLTQSLRDSENRLRMALRCAPDMVFIADPSGRIRYVNDYALESLGHTRHDLMRMSIFDLPVPNHRERFAEMVKEIMASSTRYINEVSFITKKGNEIPLELTAVKLPNGRLYGSCRDITQRQAYEREVTQVNSRLNALIEAIPDGIVFKDDEGRWLVSNESAKNIFRLHNVPWQGKNEAELSRLQPDLWAEYATMTIEDEQVWRTAKMQVFEKPLPISGGYGHFEVRKMPIYKADGSRSGLVVVARDVTERKRIEAEQKTASEQIHRLAFYDALTGLPNRRLLMDRLMQACAASARSGRHGALMFIDLDHFKNINDSQGHDIGDMLLKQVGERLTATVRDGDTIARLGGDEFVVVLQNLSAHAEESASRAEAVAEKLRSAISPPYLIKDHVYGTTMSVGIVLFKDHQASIEQLLKHADIAMYQAKAAGRNTLHFYDPVMQAEQVERIKWESELRLTVDNRQLDLFYQVQVDSEYKPVGVEALLRWSHPEHGMISPAFFIPTAEETGLIVPIGAWVLQMACAQLKEWQGNPLTSRLTLAVNVSARQVRQADFVSEVQRVLRLTGAKPELLKLELTESIVLENVEDAISKMHELKALGVTCSLDDFGTGYSSLQYLKRLPIDQMKIDQTFVRDIASDPNDATIVKTIIVMAKAMGLRVIAEGVEEDTQLSFLELCGCESFQGYLFNKPVPLNQFEDYIRDGIRYTGYQGNNPPQPAVLH